MNSKKNLVLLLIVCFLSGFGFISVCNGIPKQAAIADIEWGINVGDKFTWVVSKSNESMGFLPKNSKFELAITSIENLTIAPGLPIDGVIANFSVYNSKTKLTSNILTNETFVVFDSNFNDTFFYAPFYDHGFFIPSNYYEGFMHGYMDNLFYDFNFNLFSYGFQNNSNYAMIAVNTSIKLVCKWEFNENFVTETLTIYQSTATNIQYLLVLDGISGESTTIPLGNYYLIFFGISLSAMTYLVYKKKLARKKVKK